jgi:hypothetical protein
MTGLCERCGTDPYPRLLYDGFCVVCSELLMRAERDRLAKILRDLYIYLDNDEDLEPATCVDIANWLDKRENPLKTQNDVNRAMLMDGRKG